MELSKHISLWSKDETKVGAVIIGENHCPVSFGYNGFPRKVKDGIASRHQRPDKYSWTIHAEDNAISNAARQGTSTDGATIYCNYFPCSSCAGKIIQSGIKGIYFEKILTLEKSGNFKDPKWGKDFLVSFKMLVEAKVEINMIVGESIISFGVGLLSIIGQENYDELIEYIRDETK